MRRFISFILLIGSIATATIFFAISQPALAYEQKNTSITVRQLTKLDTPGSEESQGPNSQRRTATRTLTNPLGSTDISTIVGRAIRILTGVSGSIALLMFVYGGFLWLTSGGRPEQVTKGKKVFTWATIGLLIIFGSYAILTAIFGALGVT